MKPTTPVFEEDSPPQLRKRWILLLPVVFVTYSFAYLDRANYGFGAAAGLADTLHITESQSALLGSLFFLGYFLFQVPGAAYARRKSARWLIFGSLVSWGLLASLTGVIHSFGWLALDRLLLGVAESFILPALLLLLANWFSRSERSRANTMLIMGNPVTMLWMSAITGYLIERWGWQAAFIAEGVPSILWGIVWLAVVRDTPRQAAWMTEASCSFLERKLESEQQKIPTVTNFLAALRNSWVIAICFQYFFWSTGVYGFTLWLPVMVHRSAAMGMTATGLLSAVPYLLAVLSMFAVAHLSDRNARRLQFVWPCLLLGGAGLMGSFLAGPRFWWSYLFLLVAGVGMYASYGPFFAVIPEIMPKNVAAEVTALVNSFGALGGFVGAWVVGLLQARTGSSKAGFLFMSLALTTAGCITLYVALQRPPKVSGVEFAV